jgi:alpha-1,6-mannosyltransferase
MAADLRTPRPAPLLALAGAGATLLAVSSWWLAALPGGWTGPGPLGWLPRNGALAHLLSYLGLAALTVAWLLLGRMLLRTAGPVPVAAVRRFVLAAATPLLGAAPFGRDLWAYAAQGNVLRHGLDPYTYGPAAVPGAFTDEVSARWIASTSPYGPLWLRLSQAADWLTGSHPTLAALVLRLPAFAGLLLCLWAVPVLAAALGGRAAPGLWLGAAGPLVVVLGIGGGHNDLLMLGLALAGLAIATCRGVPALATAAVLTGLAVMVKSPAAIAVAFTVPVWLHANRDAPTLRRVVAASATAIACAAAAVAIVTAATGLGFGWTKQVNADAQWVSWLSLPSAVSMLAKAAAGEGVKAVDGTLRTCRNVGEVLAVLVLVAAWLLAIRARQRVAVLGWLAVAFGAAALLAPSVQPWYYAWGLAVAGLVPLGRRTLVLLTAAGLAFPVLITPSGYGYESDWRALPILAGALLVSALAIGTVHSAADDDGPDHAGAEVRADDGAEFGHI